MQGRSAISSEQSVSALPIKPPSAPQQHSRCSSHILRAPPRELLIPQSRPDPLAGIPSLGPPPSAPRRRSTLVTQAVIMRRSLYDRVAASCGSVLAHGLLRVLLQDALDLRLQHLVQMRPSLALAEKNSVQCNLLRLLLAGPKMYQGWDACSSRLSSIIHNCTIMPCHLSAHHAELREPQSYNRQSTSKRRVAQLVASSQSIVPDVPWRALRQALWGPR